MYTRQQRLRDLLTSDDSFATTLLVVLIDTYGTEALEWSPETILMELKDDFAIQDFPQDNFDRMMAAIQVVTSDDFFKRLPSFIFLCNIFSGTNPDQFDPADAKECAWGMTEALLLSPPEDENPFSEEIRHYIGQVVDQEGIRTPPDLLRLGIRSTTSGQADFSDMSLEEPSMFAAEFQMQAGKAKEIKQMVQANMTELFDQLESLPLKNGDTQKLLQRLRGGGGPEEPQARKPVSMSGNFLSGLSLSD